jgi:hypothetical protein
MHYLGYTNTDGPQFIMTQHVVFDFTVVQKQYTSWALVAHPCNPSYLRG